ncbi:MAG: MBL fold metallo-hydrolase [Myxococcaceae bacterium]
MRWALVVLALSTGCIGAFTRTSLRKLGDRFEVMLGGGGNSGILLHGDEAFVVDSKFGSYTRRLHHRVESELQHTVRRLLLTHSHVDHAGNVGLFEGVGAVLIHPNALNRLRTAPPHGTPASGPYVEVADNLQLSLGGEIVRVLYLGKGHTDGDLVALLPQRRVLITGDLVLTRYEPRVDPIGGGDILAFRGTLERMLALDFDTVVPGHGELGTRADVVRYRDYFAALEQAVRQAVAAKKTEDQAVQEITLPDFDDLAPLPLNTSAREKSVRLMYKAIVQP